MEKIKTKTRNKLTASIWKYNARHYEVIITIESAYNPSDNQCENHIFDSLKRANNFFATV